MDTIRRITAADIPEFTGSYYLQTTRGRPLWGERHCHDFYELICVLSGGCTHEADGREQSCPAGTLILLRPDDAHRFTGQEDGADVLALSVARTEMRKFLAAYGLDELAESDAGAVCGKLDAEERLRMEQRCAAVFARPDREPSCKIILGQLLSYLLETRGESGERPPETFERVCAEMNRLENAAEGVQAFLRVSQYSHAQLCRLTKRWLHATPNEYVNGIRLRYACEMIAYGDLRYEVICERIGFSSFSHFVSLLRKRYGLTPAALRKQARTRTRTV